MLCRSYRANFSYSGVAACATTAARACLRARRGRKNFPDRCRLWPAGGLLGRAFGSVLTRRYWDRVGGLRIAWGPGRARQVPVRGCMEHWTYSNRKELVTRTGAWSSICSREKHGESETAGAERFVCARSRGRSEGARRAHGGTECDGASSTKPLPRRPLESTAAALTHPQWRCWWRWEDHCVMIINDQELLQTSLIQPSVSPISPCNG